MKLLSIQVGMPQPVQFRGQRLETGIFKAPVAGPVQVFAEHLAGDGQADLVAHGGPDKAVYAYSEGAYAWWQVKRPRDQFHFGALGENLTIDELVEDETFIGDTLAIGKAVLQAAQPRIPCFKLGIKFADQGIVQDFFESKRPGVYFRVLQPGLIEAGQDLRLIDREQSRFSIGDLFRLKQQPQIDRETLVDLLAVRSLPLNFRRKFAKQLLDLEQV